MGRQFVDRMESDMDTLMLLAGQLVTRTSAASVNAPNGDLGEPARLAMRLLASFVALGLLFALLGSQTSSGAGPTMAQASLTPFSAAMWSDSIGR